jgi:predicted amidohydrolase
MSPTVTVGLAQWHAVPGDGAANLTTAMALIDELAEQGSELVVLPELWASGYDAPRLAEIVRATAEPLSGPRGEALADVACRNRIWLVAGSVPETFGHQTFNTTAVYAPDGHLIGVHRKAHLYRPTAEDQVFAPGDEATVLETDRFGRIGLATCFDGDHPGYARALRDRGARLVIMPAAYEVAAENWWDLLHPANALANGQWWITVNQCGGTGSAAMFGRSRVIAPDGSVTCEAPRHSSGSGPHLITCTIDLCAEITRADEDNAALWRDARLEIY